MQEVVEEDSEAEVEDADTPFTEAADCPDQVMAGSTGPPSQARAEGTGRGHGLSFPADGGKHSFGPEDLWKFDET